MPQNKAVLKAKGHTPYLYGVPNNALGVYIYIYIKDMVRK